MSKKSEAFFFVFHFLNGPLPYWRRQLILKTMPTVDGIVCRLVTCRPCEWKLNVTGSVRFPLRSRVFCKLILLPIFTH